MAEGMAFPVVFVVWGLVALLRHLSGKKSLQEQAVSGAETRATMLELVTAAVRFVLLLVVFGFVAAIPSHPLLALPIAALLMPPIWWPVLLLRLGAECPAAWVAYCVRPLLWRPADYRTRGFFLALGSGTTEDGWLARRAAAVLARTETRPRGPELAARALQALRRDQLEEARLLFGLVARLSSRLAARHLRAHAQHFLLADAALRGNWCEVEARCRDGLRTPTAAAFAAAARARQGPLSIAQRLGALYALLCMPHRIWAWRLLAWAQRERAARLPDLPPGTAPFAARVLALASAASAPPGSLPAARLSELGRRSLGFASDPEALRTVRLRLSELGAPATPEEILEDLQSDTREALRLQLQQSWISAEQLDADDPAAWEAQSSAVDEAQRLARLLRDSASSDAAPEPIDRWRYWARLRAELDVCWRLSGDPGLTLDSVTQPLIDSSARLWNSRQDRALAHDIGSFLHDHRRHTQNDDWREVIERNRKLMRRA
jgi:hypothetical protein